MYTNSDAQEGIPPLQKGDYCPPSKTDVRSPCPLVNALANHGHIPRNGRNIRYVDLYAALGVTGLSNMLKWGFAYGYYVEYHETPPTGWWPLIRNPINAMFRQFGVRPPGQKDSKGIPVINLDQLTLPGVVEHDVSLTRREIGQGDNISPWEDLITGLIAISRNGKEVTSEDFALRHRQRLKQQEHDNPTLKFDSMAHQLGYTEISLIQRLFGDETKGYSVPLPYVKAIFEEARLPVKEGWKKREWWSLGMFELNTHIEALTKLVGPVNFTTPSAMSVGSIIVVGILSVICDYLCTGSP